MARPERSAYDEQVYRSTLEQLFDVVPLEDEAFGTEEGEVCLDAIVRLQKEHGMPYATAAGIVVDAITEIRHNKLSLEVVHCPGDIQRG